MFVGVKKKVVSSDCTRKIRQASEHTERIGFLIWHDRHSLLLFRFCTCRAWLCIALFSLASTFNLNRSRDPSLYGFTRTLIFYRCWMTAWSDIYDFYEEADLKSVNSRHQMMNALSQFLDRPLWVSPFSFSFRFE